VFKNFEGRYVVVSVLIIAGFDPTGEAGVSRDIAVFNSLGIPCTAIPTALTVQTSEKVLSTSEIPIKSIIEAFNALDDFRAVKIGMLYDEKVVETISDFLKERNPEFIVLDPIINSSSGYPLITSKGVEGMKKNLFPLSDLITPNFDEAKLLTAEEDPEKMAKFLHSMGPKHVVITGIEDANDLFYDGENFELLKGKKMYFSFHGSGCFYSSYLLGAVYLGCSPLQAAKKAKEAIEEYMMKALKKG
jgi:hydroxymethylpyrimidine/phosphomethylpyrimidine kinase